MASERLPVLQRLYTDANCPLTYPDFAINVQKLFMICTPPPFGLPCGYVMRKGRHPHLRPPNQRDAPTLYALAACNGHAHWASNTYVARLKIITEEIV